MGIKKGVLIYSLIVLLSLVGFTKKNSKFSINYKWSKKNMCNSMISPEIKLTNVPKKTEFLYWALKDLQVPEYNHGSGKIKYTDNVIEDGALKGYRGPCPPSSSGLGHIYKFTFKALDKDKKVIAKAIKKVRCRRIRDMRR